MGDPSEERASGLAAWQWGLYPAGHVDRRNLILHVLTVPLFWLSTLAPLAALVLGMPWLALGIVGIPIALIAQGRGHKLEATAPVTFRGPGDFVARIFVEQWFTFPRYVLTGQLARAWRAAR